jgi:hypothetical protein
MNNRQKAKRFKQLYEQTLATKINPIRIESEPLNHLRVKQYVPYDDFAYVGSETIMVDCAINRMMSDLKERLKDNVIVEKDYPSRRVIFTLDVWVR